MAENAEATRPSRPRHLSSSGTGRPQRTRRRQIEGLVAHGPVGDAVVSGRTLTKVVGHGHRAATVLDAVDVHIARGRLTALLGPSGSGTSALLGLLAGLERPTSGIVDLDGQEISDLNDRQLARTRRERVGLILPRAGLVPSLTVRENLTLPLDLARRPVRPEQLRSVADITGIDHLLDERPSCLSDVEAQLATCARALIAGPAVVLADEPTGGLDARSSRRVLEVLRLAVDTLGQSLVMATHDAAVATWADTVLLMTEGRIIAELNQPDESTLLDALTKVAVDDLSRIGVGPTGARLSPEQAGWQDPLRQHGAAPNTSRASSRRTRRDDDAPAGPSPWDYR